MGQWMGRSIIDRFNLFLGLVDTWQLCFDAVHLLMSYRLLLRVGHKCWGWALGRWMTYHWWLKPKIKVTNLLCCCKSRWTSGAACPVLILPSRWCHHMMDCDLELNYETDNVMHSSFQNINLKKVYIIVILLQLNQIWRYILGPWLWCCPKKIKGE